MRFYTILILIMIILLVGCESRERTKLPELTSEELAALEAKPDFEEVIETGQPNATEANLSNITVEEDTEEVNITEELNIIGDNQTEINETSLDNQTNITQINVSDDAIKDETEHIGPHIVEIHKVSKAMAFVPTYLKIKKGGTVIWINKLDYLNKTAEVSVTAHHGLFRSPILNYNDTFEFTFTEKGNITYTGAPYTAIFKAGKIVVE